MELADGAGFVAGLLEVHRVGVERVADRAHGGAIADHAVGMVVSTGEKAGAGR